MVVYIVCFFWLCLFEILSHLFPPQNRKIFYIMGAAYITFLICFRDSMVGFESGADTKIYCDRFIWFCRNNLKTCLKIGWEPAFIILCKFISFFGQTENVYIIIMGLICLLPFFSYVKKWSSAPIITLLIFFCFFFRMAEYVNRQWCALLILLCATQYIIERKFRHFFFLWLLAVMFHRTAVAWFFLYFAYDWKINNKLLLIGMVVSVMLGLFSHPIIMYLRRFSRMNDSLYYNGGVSMLAFFWLCVFLVYLFSKERIRREPRYHLFFIMFLTAAVIQPVCFALSLWSRIVSYFSIAMIFLLPAAVQDLLKTGRNNRLAPSVWSTFICFLFLFFMRFGWGSVNGRVFQIMRFNV